MQRQIPFPAMSAPGAKRQETGGKLINCFVREAEGAAAVPYVYRRSAGLAALATISAHTGCRGQIQSGSILLHVLGDRVYSIGLSGGTYTATSLGALSGTDRITVAQNNASTPNIVAVCDAGTFNLFTGSAPTSFADGDLPVTNSVTVLDGYFIWSTEAGVIWASDLNSVSVDSNSFEGLPEGHLSRVVEHNNELFAFGDWGFRVYRNAGTSPFPLEYIGVKRDVGIFGTHTIAGFQEGWSDALIFAGADNRVYRMEGYTPIPISTPDVSRDLEAVATRDNVVADAYMAEGDAFFVLTNPGVWTWEYNLTTGLWNQRRSEGYDDWRMRCSVRAFDKWVCGDAITGDLGTVALTHRSEYGNDLKMQLYSGVMHEFPRKIGVNSAYFRFTAGQGDADGLNPIQTDPVARISWSLNGGATFGNPVVRALGAEGDYKDTIRVGRTGLSNSKGVQYLLEISDQVHVGFMGAEADVDVRAA